MGAGAECGLRMVAKFSIDFYEHDASYKGWSEMFSDPSKAVYWPLASWLNRERNIKVFFLITMFLSFLLSYGADFGVLLEKSSGWTLSLRHFSQKATSKSLPEERAWNICWRQIFVIRYLDKCHFFFFFYVSVSICILLMWASCKRKTLRDCIKCDSCYHLR